MATRAYFEEQYLKLEAQAHENKQKCTCSECVYDCSVGLNYTDKEIQNTKIIFSADSTPYSPNKLIHFNFYISDIWLHYMDLTKMVSLSPEYLWIENQRFENIVFIDEIKENINFFKPFYGQEHEK